MHALSYASQGHFLSSRARMLSQEQYRFSITKPLFAAARTHRHIVAAAQTAEKTGTGLKERVQLGNSGVEVDTICIGAWSWNDRTGYWGQNSHGNYTEDDIRDAFKTLLDNNLTFVDTAEVYGIGKSEELIGDMTRRTGSKPDIATKFAPLPYRFGADNVVKALKGSLDRLNQDSVTLYQIHWPGFPIINNWATNSFVEGLARVHRAGLSKAVGVSNFKADRVREANSILAVRLHHLDDQGVPLASNQVQYSLLYRKPESNGILQACKDTQTTLLAYSPLTQGLLTGKYTLQNKPGGPRSGVFSDERIRRIQPLLGLLRDIGSGHDKKSPAQVALNWVICKGALPICGVKNREQAEAVAGVLGWRLSESEVQALDNCSSVLQLDDMGAPFEQW